MKQYDYTERYKSWFQQSQIGSFTDMHPGLYIEKRNFISKNTFLKETEKVRENDVFNYYCVSPHNVNRGKETEAILMLHGLNERSWEKYLPWAEKLALETGKTVVLFPLAYHMNRSAPDWLQRKKQMNLFSERKKTEQNLKFSSFVNTILSRRLQQAPERFLTSGLQTYYDIVDFLLSVRTNNDLRFHPECRFDIFGYSIGAFLGEILLMCNREELFSSSRLFIFCGGSVMDRAQPQSRTIIDNLAGSSLVRFFKRLTSPQQLNQNDLPLEKEAGEKELIIFQSLLSENSFRETRNEHMSRLEGRIKALTLTKDTVFSTAGVRSTISPAPVIEMDFPFEYKHEMPFPLLKTGSGEVNKAFSEVMATTINFFGA